MNPHDPFWTEQVVVDREGDVLELRGWMPGAAGTASFALPGIEVEVDVADAGRLVAARVEDPVAGRESVASLIGIERVDAVLGGRSQRGEPRDAGRRRRASNADHPMTRVALLRLDLSDEDLPDDLRAAALVEAAALAGDAADAAFAADLLMDVDVDPPDDSTARDLADVCREAAALLDGRRADVLRRAATRFDRWRGGIAMEPAPMMAPAAAAASRRMLAPIADLVPQVDTSALSHRPTSLARWRGPSELEIVVDTDDAWARVTGEDGTPLAVVPVLSGVARVLVAPATGLVVDVTHRPDLAPPTPERRRVEEALVDGVEACRADRLGARWRAAPRWRACADGWHGAGDADRADEARAYADGTRTTNQPRPSIADRLRQ